MNRQFHIAIRYRNLVRIHVSSWSVFTTVKTVHGAPVYHQDPVFPETHASNSEYLYTAVNEFQDRRLPQQQRSSWHTVSLLYIQLTYC